jgi:hypothetical protein
MEWPALNDPTTSGFPAPDNPWLQSGAAETRGMDPPAPKKFYEAANRANGPRLWGGGASRASALASGPAAPEGALPAVMNEDLLTLSGSPEGCFPKSASKSS